MNHTTNIDSSNTAIPGSVTRKHLSNSPLDLLRRLCGTIRELCPTWEEWQATVEFYPVPDQQ
jgi:hypothetical protein